jgi:two-component system, LytTR family, response regulator
MELKAVIIEDEKANRETLHNYIEKYCTGLSVVAEATSVKEGLEVIKTHQPDIVFLDVEMPYGNGFDLLEQVDEVNFATVFVTAYSEYAIKALNFSASYYILKPIDIDELIKAVDKIKLEKQERKHSFSSKILIENLQTANKQFHKIVLPLIDGFEVISVKDIVRIQANDNFSDFHLVDGTKKMICRTLKFYDEMLNEFEFLRIHKSHLINLQYVKKYIKGKGGQVLMIDDSVVDVSPSKKQDLLSRF